MSDRDDNHYILRQHIKKVCIPNLNNRRYRHCATCPFEDAIVSINSKLRYLFVAKRKLLRDKEDSDKKQGKLKL